MSHFGAEAGLNGRLTSPASRSSANSHHERDVRARNSAPQWKVASAAICLLINRHINTTTSRRIPAYLGDHHCNFLFPAEITKFLGVLMKNL